MATIRENVVVLKSDRIKSVKVVEGTLVATKGQPTESRISVDVSEGIASLLVRSGRKKSKPIAEAFVRDSGGNVFATQGGGGGRPKELNFYFGVDIVWDNISVTRVFLGQGSYGVRNNWWIGSEALSTSSGATLDIGNGVALRIGGTSFEDDIGGSYGKIKDSIPSQYQGLVDMIGKPLFKELFGSVNVFVFSEE